MKSKTNTYILISFTLGLILYSVLRPYDSTDDPLNKLRSGMTLYTDFGTGCQYISAGMFSSLIGLLTPRTDKDGNQVGCTK